MAPGRLLTDAVETYHRANPRDMFSTSSPPLPSASQMQPLRRTTASKVNSQQPNVGVKRTSDGLAKALGGSFEGMESENVFPEKNSTGASKRVEYNKRVVSKAPQREVIVIDEDDFSSDVDLDIEEPKMAPLLPRAAISYPAIVATPQASLPLPSSPKPIAYPTLPRQQQMQSSFVDLSDPPIPSSIPVDWSSSPAHHLQPRHPGFQKASALQASQLPAPRTLPWKTESTTAKTYDDSKALRTEQRKDAFRALADPKRANEPMTNKRSELWKFSATTLKEQQKLHREESKPIVKEEKKERPASTRQKKVAKVFLSTEQQHVLDLVVDKKQSTFFTGSAGTGKSVLLREIIAAYRRVYKKEPDRVAVTASTGLAACNVGGVTLHSFAGIGLGKEEVPELVKKIKRNAKAKQRWMRTKVLIVDEVSMVDADLFDKLEHVARLIRNNGRPFGGIQLVITGDFFQLPPVPERGQQAKFCFDAAQWSTTIANVIGLTHVYRQKDPVFAGMLNEMRMGQLKPSSVEAFKRLDRELLFEDEIQATALFPLRKEVDTANNRRLQDLQGAEFTFEAKDGGSMEDKVARDRLLQNCMAPQTITLKKGAQVMLIKNVDDVLVNGSIGRVLSFMDENEFDKFRMDDDVWADVDSSTHAALREFGMSKEEKARKRLTDNTMGHKKFPMVRFSIPDGTSRDMLCQQETWKVELPSGEVQASRLQIPLILSWALSIHKAQGQTLERVTVDLGQVFEKGQAYVALSRATSMAGLQVKNFNEKKVMAHDRVRAFYAQLQNLDVKAANTMC